jgi:hypothetical protein
MVRCYLFYDWRVPRSFDPPPVACLLQPQLISSLADLFLTGTSHAHLPPDAVIERGWITQPEGAGPPLGCAHLLARSLVQPHIRMWGKGTAAAMELAASHVSTRHVSRLSPHRQILR